MIGGLVLVYLIVAINVLPQWIVSLTAGAADANTQLNAVTNTRGALLGLITPLVIAIGGVVGFLNFQEIRAQNVRTNELARAERDETRRTRRAEVYAELISSCNASWNAAGDLYSGDTQEAATRIALLKAVGETRSAMELAYDRVRLLGADVVQDSARELNHHLGAQVITKANAKPKLSEADWKRLSIAEYAALYRAFLAAARKDLELAP